MRQGTIDGLCAVYAVLNACQLLAVTGDERIAPDVRLDQTKRLFRALCLSEETRDLFPRIVCAGTREEGIELLLQVAQRWALRHSCVELYVEQPPLTHVGGAPKFFEALRVALKRQSGERKAYVLGLAQPRDHWTVVRSIRAGRLTLFDSHDFPSPRRNWAHPGEFTFDRHAKGLSGRSLHVIDAGASYLLSSRQR